MKRLLLVLALLVTSPFTAFAYSLRTPHQWEEFMWSHEGNAVARCQYVRERVKKLFLQPHENNRATLRAFRRDLDDEDFDDAFEFSDDSEPIQIDAQQNKVYCSLTYVQDTVKLMKYNHSMMIFFMLHRQYPLPEALIRNATGLHYLNPKTSQLENFVRYKLNYTVKWPRDHAFHRESDDPAVEVVLGNSDALWN